jgi:hypothetical protein
MTALLETCLQLSRSSQATERREVLCNIILVVEVEMKNSPLAAARSEHCDDELSLRELSCRELEKLRGTLMLSLSKRGSLVYIEAFTFS